MADRVFLLELGASPLGAAGPIYRLVELLALLAGGALATLPASCSPGSSNDSRLGPSGHVDGEALHYASLRDVARLPATPSPCRRSIQR